MTNDIQSALYLDRTAQDCRSEDDYCECGTYACCIDHTIDHGPCECF